VLLAGFLPFDESTIVSLFQKIQKAEFTYPSWFPEHCRSLIGQMLVSDPSKRLTLAQVKEHEWMKTELSAEKLEEIISSSISKPDLSDLNEGENNVEDEDDDDDDKSISKGPIKLNAFDTINQCGGFLLDRMLTVPKVVGDLPKLGSFASLNIENNSTSFSGRNTKNIHYTSSIPPVELISAVHQALLDVGCSIPGTRLKSSQTGKIHATKVTQKGMVAFFIQSFELCPSLSLLAIKRGKGDLLEWNSLFKELVDNYLKDLINKPNEDGEAKSDSCTTGYTPR
jgi:serine/threonine protein kinase